MVHEEQREWKPDERDASKGELSDRRMIQRPGAVYLLRNDPLTQGPRLFSQHCASCHDYRGPERPKPETEAPHTAPEHRVHHLANQKLSPLTTGKGDDIKVQRDAAGKVMYPACPRRGRGGSTCCRRLTGNKLTAGFGRETFAGYPSYQLSWIYLPNFR